MDEGELVAIAVELNNKELEAIARRNLGNAYFSSQRYQEAKNQYEQSLSIAVEIGDISEECKAYASLGNVYSVLAKYNDVIRCHKKALELAVEEGNHNYK